MTLLLHLTNVEDAPSPMTDDEPDALSSNSFSASTSINHHHHSTTASSPSGVGGHHHGDHDTHVRTYPTIAEVEEEGEDGKGGGGDIVNSLTVTLTLPEHSRGRGIQPSQRRRDEKRLLVFHGIILRSQLVILLQNKIFFSEGDGVSITVTVLFAVLLHGGYVGAQHRDPELISFSSAVFLFFFTYCV